MLRRLELFRFNSNTSVDETQGVISLDLTTPVPLSWSRQDIEERFGFRGARFTDTNTFLSLLIGSLITILFYAALLPFRETYFGQMHLARGPIPFATSFFINWSIAILFLKSRKLALQRRSLDFAVVPADPGFVLSAATVETVTDQIYAVVDDPKYFVLFNRIVIALSNLRNLGQVTEVDGILRSQGEHDESSMETSYTLLGGFVWAIPVLGFIGTVLGLSEAIGGFSSVLQGAAELGEIKVALQGVTGGLATAFETTLQALVGALCIQLYLTYLKKSELQFLEQCAAYCVKNVVNKLRIMPYETGTA
jgi:biopolymer transport protein ExbB/TolQ